MDPIATAAIVKALALAGAGLAIGLGAIGPGIGEGLSAGSASLGIARQSATSFDLFRIMLVGQAVTETSGIFALVVAILLLFGKYQGVPLIDGFSALGAGLSIGAASLASGVGAGFPAARACEAIARQPYLRSSFTTMMLIGQAVSQTPVIFALLISFLLIFLPARPNAGIVDFVAMLSAGLCMGFGAVGPSIGSGIAAESAIIGVRNHRDPPSSAGLLTRVMLLGQAVAQSTSIYAMVVASVLIMLR